jgi:Ulp1 family protease
LVGFVVNHGGTHWGEAIVVDLPDVVSGQGSASMFLFDSLASIDQREVFKNIENLLREEYRSRYPQLNQRAAKFKAVHFSKRMQTNAYDCGVYVCEFFERALINCTRITDSVENSNGSLYSAIMAALKENISQDAVDVRFRNFTHTNESRFMTDSLLHRK